MKFFFGCQPFDEVRRGWYWTTELEVNIIHGAPTATRSNDNVIHKEKTKNAMIS